MRARWFGIDGCHCNQQSVSGVRATQTTDDGDVDDNRASTTAAAAPAAVGINDARPDPRHTQTHRELELNFSPVAERRPD